jgi:hypothetical protein
MRSLFTSLETHQGRQPPTALQLVATPALVCASSVVSLGTSLETVRHSLLPPSARPTVTVPHQEDTAGSPMVVVSEVPFADPIASRFGFSSCVASPRILYSC